jgi:CheY-like chemotaxis protein
LYVIEAHIYIVFVMKRIPLILLADDNPDDHTFIRDAFTYVNANVELKILGSGQELLQQLKFVRDEDLPSLIVLDYNMPKMNGAEVLKVLLKEERFRHIPKIILSTSYFQDHIDHCINIGADGYLIKPDNLFSWQKIALNMLEYVQ